MADSPAPQPPKDDGPCMICCTTRATTIGMVSGGLLGGVFGAMADIALSKSKTIVWRLPHFPLAEKWSSTLLVASVASLGSISVLSAAYPASNKGYDTDLPYWGWNGATAGLIAAPLAASAYYWSDFPLRKTRSFSYFSKCLAGALVPSLLFGGLLLQDYWRLLVVDRPWGDKCLPPRAPRKFRPLSYDD